MSLFFLLDKASYQPSSQHEEDISIDMGAQEQQQQEDAQQQQAAQQQQQHAQQQQAAQQQQQDAQQQQLQHAQQQQQQQQPQGANHGLPYPSCHVDTDIFKAFAQAPTHICSSCRKTKYSDGGVTPRESNTVSRQLLLLGTKCCCVRQ